MSEHIDKGDYKTLLVAILRQAIDDYVKLLHPRYRRKKYLQEAWQDAIDMFFDSNYRMLRLKNEMGEDMSIKDLIAIVLESEQADISQLQNHVIDEAVAFWEDKPVRTIEIPDTVVVNGHVYYIYHTEEDSCTTDLDEKTVTLNKNSKDSENEERFIQALMELALHHEDITMSKKNVESLSKAWFRILRLNNCFIGDT